MGPEEIALKLLEIAISAFPGLAHWIDGLITGQAVDTGLTRRIADILPAESESKKALRDLDL